MLKEIEFRCSQTGGLLLICFCFISMDLLTFQNSL